MLIVIAISVMLSLIADYDNAREDLPFGAVPLVPGLANVIDLNDTDFSETNGVVTLKTARNISNVTVTHIVTGQYDPTLLRATQFFASPTTFNLTVNNATYEGEVVGGKDRRLHAAALLSAATVADLQTHAWRSAEAYARVAGIARLANVTTKTTLFGARRWGHERCVVERHSTDLMRYAVCRGTPHEEIAHVAAWLKGRVGTVALASPRTYTAVEKAALYAIAWAPAVMAVVVAAVAVVFG